MLRAIWRQRCGWSTGREQLDPKLENAKATELRMLVVGSPDCTETNPEPPERARKRTRGARCPRRCLMIGAALPQKSRSQLFLAFYARITYRESNSRKVHRMTRKSEAFEQMAPLLGINASEARLWARHLREAGYIEPSLPGHGISRVTEDELVNFVVGFACCRHAKHAPKYLQVVRAMTREDNIVTEDPEARPLPPFLDKLNFIDAFKALIWDVYEGRFSEWGRSTVPPGIGPNTGGLFVEFVQDGFYVDFLGVRYEPDAQGIHRRAASFHAPFALHRGIIMHRDEDDLPGGADLRITKTIGFRTLHTMAEILIGS